MIKEKTFYKSFMVLALSLALQNLLTYGVNLMDTMMLGRYSQDAMGGVSLCNQVQFLLQMLVVGAGEGAVVMGSQYWGKNKLEPIPHIIGVALRFGGSLAVLMFGIVLFFPHQLLSLLSNSPTVIAEGEKYFQIICFTYIIFTITNILVASLRSIGVVKIGYMISGSTLIINVCLNYCLIYGHFGCPELGVRGAAMRNAGFPLCGAAHRYLLPEVQGAQAQPEPAQAGSHRHQLCAGLHARFPAGAHQSGALGHRADGTDRYPRSSRRRCHGCQRDLRCRYIRFCRLSATAPRPHPALWSAAPSARATSSGCVRSSHTLQVLFVSIGLCSGLSIFLLRGPDPCGLLGGTLTENGLHACPCQFMLVLAITTVGTSYQMACDNGIIRGGGDTAFSAKMNLVSMWLHHRAVLRDGGVLVEVPSGCRVLPAEMGSAV